MSENVYDVVVIGAGQNGLMAGATAADAGKKTLIIDRNKIVGGMCTTEEIPSMPEGFKFNLGAMSPGMICGNPKYQELQIEDKYGLEWFYPSDEDPLWTYLFPDGTYWHIYKDLKGKTADEIERVAGPGDAQRWREFCDYFGSMFEIMDAIMYSEAMTLDEMLAMLAGGGEDMDLGPEMTDFARYLFMSADQLLDEWFDSDYIKGPLLKASKTMGNAGYEQNSGIWAAEILGISSWRHVKGGSGELPNALARCAEDKGAEIRLNTEVEKVLTENGQVTGVRLNTGEVIKCKAVVSSLDCKRLLGNMVDQDELDEKFKRRLNALRDQSMSLFCLHAAVDGIPDFAAKYPGIDNEKAAASNIVFCEGVTYNDYFEADMAHGRLPEGPVAWIYMPSVEQPELCPPGKHCLTMASYTPAIFEGGGTFTPELKKQCEEIYLNQLYTIAPSLKDQIIDVYCESYEDLCARAGGPFGNTMGIDMNLCQLFMFRPLPEMVKSNTPIKGLYLGGNDVWPFGAVSGVQGWHGAEAAVRDIDNGSL